MYFLQSADAPDPIRKVIIIQVNFSWHYFHLNGLFIQVSPTSNLLNKAEYFSTITLKLVQSCLHSFKINKQTKCSCVHFSIFGEWLYERLGKFDNWGTLLTTLVFIYEEFIDMLQTSRVHNEVCPLASLAPPMPFVSPLSPPGGLVESYVILFMFTSFVSGI